jgi:hypothetical protein
VSNEPRPIGPYDDPRLTDRRGDLSGFSALLFAGIALLALALVGLVLFLAIPPAGSVASPSPSPSPTPTPTPTPRPSVSLAASPSAATSPRPSITVPTIAVGQRAPLVGEDGTQAGTVAIQATRFARNVGGEPARPAMRYLVARVRYQAREPLRYDRANWVAVDAEGNEHRPREDGDLDSALGSGRLNAGEAATGTVTFEVPRQVPVEMLVLRSAEGEDLVRVSLG